MPKGRSASIPVPEERNTSPAGERQTANVPTERVSCLNIGYFSRTRRSQMYVSSSATGYLEVDSVWRSLPLMRSKKLTAALHHNFLIVF
jgi:hypothetical protein